MFRLIILFFAAIIAASTTSVHISTLDLGVVRVSAFSDDSSTLWISVPDVCEKTGIKTVWAPERRKLLLYFNETDIQLVESNPYIYSGGKLADMGSTPVMKMGEFFLQPNAMALMLSVILGKVMEFDTADNVIAESSDRNKVLVTSAVRDTLKAIRKAVIDEKKNGTMLTIYLPDSLVFDYTYFKPQLNINVVKGRISASEIRRDTPLGLVNEMDAVQFAENAQISVILSDKALAPEVRFKSNPFRIEVVIRGEIIPVKPEDSLSDTTIVKVVDTTKGQAVVKEESVSRPVRNIRTIYIDPGHGGKDPGAVNKKLKALEKDAVFTIALLAAKRIRDINPSLNVKLTRAKDEFVRLGDRAKIANKGAGDLFISLHLNSVSGNASKQASVSGYCVYFLDVAKSDEARAAAALENSVLELEENSEEQSGVSDVDFILKSAELNLYRNESEDLAIMIEKATASRVSEYGRYHNGVDQANFYVLRGPEMPSVLFEIGFICNPKEARLLFNPDFQAKIADAIATGVASFKDKYEKNQTPR